MTTLTLFLMSGLLISEPISIADCRDLLGISRYVDARGLILTRPEGQVAGLECNGESFWLSLPPAMGICELGETI